MAKTLNSLMKHLRESGIQISGSAEKRRLKNMGYYHCYKGYRFAGTASNRLPLTDFSQLAALYDFDMELKALLYPRVMQVETALKNYTLKAVLADAESENFDVIYRKSLTGYRSKEGKRYVEAWSQRQRLRSQVDALISQYHNQRDVIMHFRDKDEEIPVWAIFEVMSLGTFGMFYGCLDQRVKTAIVTDLGMPSSFDSGKVLEAMIFALKDLRNAVAHNSVVLDTRFRSGSIPKSVGKLLEAETGVKSIDFTDITDYVVVIAYLMRCMKFTKTECRQFVAGYEAILEKYRALLPSPIYLKIIRTSARRKVGTTKDFLRG